MFLGLIGTCGNRNAQPNSCLLAFVGRAWQQMTDGFLLNRDYCGRQGHSKGCLYNMTSDVKSLKNFQTNSIFSQINLICIKLNLQSFFQCFGPNLKSYSSLFFPTKFNMWEWEYHYSSGYLAGKHAVDWSGPYSSKDQSSAGAEVSASHAGWCFPRVVGFPWCHRGSCTTDTFLPHTAGHHNPTDCHLHHRHGPVVAPPGPSGYCYWCCWADLIWWGKGGEEAGDGGEGREGGEGASIQAKATDSKFCVQ